MRYLSLGLLVVAWSLWIATTVGQAAQYAGWSFVLLYLAIGVGLFAIGMAATHRLMRVFLYFGGGFFLLSLGELGWLLLFPDGSAGSETFLPNLPYLAADVIFAFAAWQMIQSLRAVAPLYRVALLGIIAAALVLVGFTDAPEALSQAGANTNAWISLLVNVADDLANMLACLLLLALGYLTWGGRWSKAVLPASIGFALRLVGNVLYTLNPGAYAYGGTSDWFWFLGTTVLAYYVLRDQRENL